MGTSLFILLMMSQIETTKADTLVAPPGASTQFRESKPAPKIKTQAVPVNPTAGAATPGSIRPQTVQPADVAMQQPLPQQTQALRNPITYPTQAIPNVNSQQTDQQAMQMLQQIIQMLGGGNGNIPGQTPMYLPNGQLNPAWVQQNRGKPDAPYYGRTGVGPVNRDFPGLSSAPDLSAIDAARRLKGHTCNPNDSDRLTCMVCNLMYEAGNEPREGQLAVAQSVMTRAFSSKYPDTVCKVVYQNNGRVAQYSWTFENKNHTLPDSSKVDELVQVALEGMRKGPNGLTNYFAWRLVDPDWGRSGECARTTTRVGGHQFCTINGTMDRTVSQYMSSENLPTGRGHEPASPTGTAR